MKKRFEVTRNVITSDETSIVVYSYYITYYARSCCTFEKYLSKFGTFSIISPTLTRGGGATGIGSSE